MEVAPNGVFSVVPPVGGGGEPRGSEIGRVPLHHPLDGPAGAERPLRVPRDGEELEPILTLPQLVPTRHRDDGWTAQRQRDFLENLASCGSVAAAARSVGMSRESAYALRRRAGGGGFLRLGMRRGCWRRSIWWIWPGTGPARGCCARSITMAS